jgi:hypothetical protein
MIEIKQLDTTFISPPTLNIICSPFNRKIVIVLVKQSIFTRCTLNQSMFNVVTYFGVSHKQKKIQKKLKKWKKIKKNQ